MNKHFFLAFLATSFFVPAVFACSCIPFELEEQIANADMIFTGKMARYTSPDSQTREYSFEAGQVWKGTDAETFTVRSSPSSAACGYSFKLNEYYLVYATENEEGLVTTTCSATKLLSAAAEDIRLLKGETPLGDIGTDDGVEDTQEDENDEKQDAPEGFFQIVWRGIQGFFAFLFG